MVSGGHSRSRIPRSEGMAVSGVYPLQSLIRMRSEVRFFLAPPLLTCASVLDRRDGSLALKPRPRRGLGTPPRLLGGPRARRSGCGQTISNACPRAYRPTCRSLRGSWYDRSARRPVPVTSSRAMTRSRRQASGNSSRSWRRSTAVDRR